MKYEIFEVAAPGGKLRGGMWGSQGPVVLLAHGVTANHLTFALLAEQLGEEMRLIAPDLRGRGRSTIVDGPWGIDVHAADLVRVLDHLQLPKADVLVGQSMGGFVAVVAAAEHPDRFGAVLLADGGLPVMEKLPWFLPLTFFMRMALGPAMKRLMMSFESRRAYQEYWRAHPALADDWSPSVERYVDYDLVGDAPLLRSSVSRTAVIEDTRSMITTGHIPLSLRALRGPVRLLRAPRGLMNGKALYSEKTIDLWRSRIRNFSCVTVPDVNHYTLLMSERGAKACAEEIRKLSRLGA